MCYSGFHGMEKEGDYLWPIETHLSVLASTPAFFTCRKLSRPLPYKLSLFIVFWTPAGSPHTLDPHRKLQVSETPDCTMG